MSPTNKFVEEMSAYGGPINIVTTVFRAVSLDGSARRFPTPCYCLKKLLEIVTLNNYLAKRGYSLPMYLEEDLQMYVDGKGFGCQYHWNYNREQEVVRRSVYYVEIPEIGMIKIGYSDAPYKRLGDIRAKGFGDTANIIALECGGKEEERESHKMFRSSRNRVFSHDGGTELFLDSEELRDWTSKLREENGMNRQPKFYEYKVGTLPPKN